VGRSDTSRDVRLAATLLTIVPLRVPAPKTSERSGAAAWFPLVGLLLGLIVAAFVSVARIVLPAAPATLAAASLVLLALLTRLLHWDGLADVSDAFFVAKERRLDVLADTHVGAFGATGIALVALLEWSVLQDLIAAPSGLGVIVVAVAFSRFAATCAAWFGVPARPGGLGASVHGRPGPLGVVAAALALAAAVAAAFALGLTVWTAIAVALAATVLALAAPHLLSMRFGGVTGDIMGASVVLVEAGVLLAGVVAIAVLRTLGV
jgi:adenosylcobinamide-GDP ribazoletransferase